MHGGDCPLRRGGRPSRYSHRRSRHARFSGLVGRRCERG
ncbi:hypothetical protein NSERUTF1_6015 [Nocardia seriolae]|nr:hypothetical protein NSERUTF1_6015 [Nocardia seriolae]